MQVFTFPLNERGDAKLVVSVHNVPPMMGMPTPPTPAYSTPSAPSTNRRSKWSGTARSGYGKTKSSPPGA